jgi:hypothetical protein
LIFKGLPHGIERPFSELVQITPRHAEGARDIGDLLSP